MYLSYRHDPNSISFLIDEANNECDVDNFGTYDHEEHETLHDQKISNPFGTLNVGTNLNTNRIRKLNNNIDSIHHYQSQVSVGNSENEYTDNSTNQNFVTINDENTSEMNSYVTSSNMCSETGEDLENSRDYDTLRKFHYKKSDLGGYGSNNVKY